MPIVLYSVSEAVNWLMGQGRKITGKGLRRAISRGDLRCIHMGEHPVVPQEELEAFIENPPRRGRPIKG